MYTLAVVRVALDCYRILGVPAQTAVEDIRPFISQRLQSGIRSDYSSLAVAARRKLIERAYQTIIESATTAEQSSENTEMRVSPVVWVEGEDLPGALALWLEWGEYEQILKTGQAACQNGIPPNVYSDTVLTMVLAYLELGREQWQQQNYQRAGVYLEQGLALLQSTGGLFPHLEQELRIDLARLRPYRILELVALPLEDEPGRRAGLTLLRQMLDERGGIEGTGDAAAGLGVEEGLRFLQQLRPYMTLVEQYEHFGREARRPSAVGAYLAAQAALGLGVMQHQPQRIREAEGWLRFLHRSQPVPLELAITTLLLGQTEAALAFWQQHVNSGSVEAQVLSIRRTTPDELVALYRYAQIWLHREILPFARDVTAAALSIQSYFDDPQVVALLDRWQAPETPPATTTPVFSAPRPRRRRRRYDWVMTGAVAAATAIGLVWWLRSPRPQRLLITLEQPPVPLPSPSPSPEPPTADPRAAALETLTTWQKVKAQALGAQHAIDQLSTILVDPALSQWRERARQLQEEGIAETHTLKRLEIARMQMTKPDEMVVEARIEDQVQVQGQDVGSSNYRARYELIKSPKGWRIRRIALLP
ncbi:MAG: ARC6/PARC6 family protein [Gloeomargarita sp. SKYG116]|nr:ARC6/PARC6 family protein [Gloeomargarita sp. SKYG116]MCS7226316.1 ARC6/PARC6 family protein [Gloeomargarita sp. SKYB31]MDW8402194.1 ARC6/PARC6 family protein [Gloeomargarita sp. SKYGB_i_bin116]